MAKFEYGKTVADSFRLIFNNLYVFAPLLLISVIGLLLSPSYYKLVNPESGIDFQSMLANPGIISLIIVGYLVLLVLSYIAYGWTFALIGKLVQKGKADFLGEFKNAPKKGLWFFLVNIILLLIIIGIMIVLLILIMIGALITVASKVLGIILVALLVIALLFGLAFLSLIFMYVVPLISLQDIGPINAIKGSFEHFKANKKHSLALVGIMVLFFLAAGIIIYAVLFSVVGTMSNEALLAYMFSNPVMYTFISFFAGLPSYVITIWSIAFLTVAYARKKKVTK